MKNKLKKEPGKRRTIVGHRPAVANQSGRIEKCPSKIQVEVLGQRLGFECNLRVVKLHAESLGSK
ncbi:MAG: hypothetical protein ACQEV0_01625 [Bacillota bacterium]